MTKAIIEMENGGTMTLELYPETAPITVENFVKLANEGFYNGLIFHRVIAGFMIQGGDPMGIGIGGSGKNIKGEPAVKANKGNCSDCRYPGCKYNGKELPEWMKKQGFEK